jgi:hypothetical protein
MEKYLEQHNLFFPHYDQQFLGMNQNQWLVSSLIM